jgi:hypothetical protein
MARRRPDRLLLRLFYTTLVILAAMHPAAIGHMAQAAATLLLAIVDGITRAANDQPGPAILTAGAIYIAHQIRTHRPRTRART